MCHRVAQRPAPTPMPSPSNIESTPSVSSSSAASATQAQQGGSLDLEWARMTVNFGNVPAGGSPTSYCPAPNTSLSSAPAGQGLTKNSDGSITTAGGYKIQPEGKDAAFKVFGPDGKELTRVWGDPHVSEGDGTRWDFTKDSNFVLPDGTRIGVDTTSQEGKSVTQALDIANGSDRVKINGINSNAPQTGEITRDGLAGWQAENGANRDTFALRHDAANQDWVKFDPTGKLNGVVTGAKFENNAYNQTTTGADSKLGGVGATSPFGNTAPTFAGGDNAFGLAQLFQMLGLGNGWNLGNGFGVGNGLGAFGMGNGLGLDGGLGNAFGMSNAQGANAFQDPFGLGFGGLGSAGLSPYNGYQAFALLQALMQSSLREQQMQIEMGRMRAIFR